MKLFVPIATVPADVGPPVVLVVVPPVRLPGSSFLPLSRNHPAPASSSTARTTAAIQSQRRLDRGGSSSQAYGSSSPGRSRGGMGRGAVLGPAAAPSAAPTPAAAAAPVTPKVGAPTGTARA